MSKTAKENVILRTHRKLSWERAKVELIELTRTFYSHDRYEEMNNEVRNFIKRMEHKGIKELKP